VSANRLTFEGASEFLAALRRLPEELTGEAGSIVVQSASDAAQDVRGAYQSRQRTGKLANGVKVTQDAVGRFGVTATVRSTAPHAHLFEVGTQARHTAIGANRGSMPAGHAFVPAMVRHRRRMVQRLKALLEKKGLEVTGDAR
jgi:hypothetical protein